MQHATPQQLKSFQQQAEKGAYAGNVRHTDNSGRKLASVFQQHTPEDPFDNPHLRKLLHQSDDPYAQLYQEKVVQRANKFQQQPPLPPLQRHQNQQQYQIDTFASNNQQQQMQNAQQPGRIFARQDSASSQTSSYLPQQYPNNMAYLSPPFTNEAVPYQMKQGTVAAALHSANTGNERQHILRAGQNVLQSAPYAADYSQNETPIPIQEYAGADWSKKLQKNIEKPQIQYKNEVKRRIPSPENTNILSKYHQVLSDIRELKKRFEGHRKGIDVNTNSQSYKDVLARRINSALNLSERRQRLTQILQQDRNL